jgi:DNA-binding NtrC family response regulator
MPSKRIWIADKVRWWSTQVSDALCRCGYDVTVTGSLAPAEIRSCRVAFPAPDVVVYACAATTVDDLHVLAALAEGPWLVILMTGDIDVSMACSIFECGVTAIGARYDSPVEIVRTIERATRNEQARQTRQAAWSVPA